MNAPKFAVAARDALADTGLRRTLRTANATARERRAVTVGETSDWEALREAGRAIGERTLLDLDRLLETLEERVTAAGGVVHWARDAAEANRVVTSLVRATGEREVVAARSAVSREIGLGDALAGAGIEVCETGLAEMVAQWDGGRAGPRSRAEIREIFRRETSVEVGDDPAEIAAAARARLRDRFLAARVAVVGADFTVAETGTVVLREPEGNGRMCLTLPETLIAVVGIEQTVPSWRDLEVFLQLLPRAATGERIDPHVSTWTGVTPGDGPTAFHLVLVDNGRTKALADEVGRAALRCVGCAACLSVCPVYERTGGDAYGAVYQGPIGAVRTPLMAGVERAREASLPYASTLCGACADVCPVKIDIPRILVHLRGQVIESRRRRPVPTPEMLVMRSLAWTMGDRGRYEQALTQSVRWGGLLSRGGRIRRLPGLLGKWSDARDLPAPPRQSFRAWWRKR